MATEQPVSGAYEGQYLDAFGHRGNLYLTLSFANGNVTGSYEARLADEDDASRTLTGSIEGTYADNTLALEVTLDNGDILTLDAQGSDAGSYGNFGFYGLVNPPPSGNFGGGVWIAWNYNQEA